MLGSEEGDECQWRCDDQHHCYYGTGILGALSAVLTTLEPERHPSVPNPVVRTPPPPGLCHLDQKESTRDRGGGRKGKWVDEEDEGRSTR